MTPNHTKFRLPHLMCALFGCVALTLPFAPRVMADSGDNAAGSNTREKPGSQETQAAELSLDPTPGPGVHPLHARVTVNSDEDGQVHPDDALTLREAIDVINGTLPLDQLSIAEKAQVAFLKAEEAPRIEFNLPHSKTTIRLIAPLPPLASQGMIIDGATQEGYKAAEVVEGTRAPVPSPVVALTPAVGATVPRGLTIVADGVAVRALSLYGFTAPFSITASTPPADIFISQRLPPVDRRGSQPPASTFPSPGHDIPPRDVLIELNWLGSPPEGGGSEVFSPSAFGVYLFNSAGATIRQNRVAGHNGSGIITSLRASNLQITGNVVEQNGLAGMPDAIRLEGIIDHCQIADNLIRENGGSAVYLFKTTGAVQVRNNVIVDNGQKVRKAAIYLMGDGHTVTENHIANQPGPGVTVAAYPRSRHNEIRNNRFNHMEGMSIDLVAQQDVESQDYLLGDGPNPPNNSYQRRRETGNFGMEAPRFLSPLFFLSSRDGTAVILGKAQPDSQVELYRVTEAGLRGPLNQPIATATADGRGRFSITTAVLQPGDRISATATYPGYGTSEPALNAVIRTLPVQGH